MKQAVDVRWRGGSYQPIAEAIHYEQRQRQISIIPCWYESNNFSAMLVYFPLFCDGIVLPAHEEFDAPDYKSKEDIHPPPPHLRRVIED